MNLLPTIGGFRDNEGQDIIVVNKPDSTKYKVSSNAKDFS